MNGGRKIEREKEEGHRGGEKKKQKDRETKR